MTIYIEDINKAFTPKKEIQNPEQFIGRYEEIKQCLNFLNTGGSFLMIFGLRGLGKSSLANQVMKVAEGNETLLELCQLTKFKPRKGFNYFVHVTKCDDFVRDIPTLIKRIVLGDESNKALYDYLKDGSQKIDKAIELFAKRDKQTKEVSNEISEDLIHLFRQALSVIKKDNQEKDGIIILIDEFDLIEDKSNFASLIKSVSNEFIKFGVIGIADDIHDLVSDHSSIARQIEPVEVGLMIEDELKLIIDHAEKEISNEITFTTSAKKLIITNAKGFPYYVHLLGKEALMIAFERDVNEINVSIIEECIVKIKQGLSKSIHETNYVLLANSDAREKLLRLIATNEENYINTENIYSEYKELYNIEKPSKYMNELIENVDEKPALKLVKKGKFCRFVDPLFKLYITLREPIYE